MNDAAHPPTPAATWAVVVLFHPPGDLAVRLAPVLRQTAGLILVANDGVVPSGALAVGVKVIVNPMNRGLAAALNQGIDMARRHHARWVLLLDQDTAVDDDLLIGLERTWEAAGSPPRTAILAANYRSYGGGRTAYATEVAFQRVATVVTSGSLVAMAALEECGGMKEEFFIEAIDLEFALRVRRGGWGIIASGRTLMTHAAGAGREWRLGGRTILVGDHPPWRCYLQIRNLIWTLRHHGLTDPWWTCTTLAAIVKKAIITCLAEEAATTKLEAWLSGCSHGLCDYLPPPFEAPATIL